MPIKFTIERRENQKAYGTLRWPEKNLKSGAISGPYGRGELPLGLYHAMRSDLLDKAGQNSFCDSLKNCWFQLLIPQFSTNRNGIGIHPDGGDYIGTQGCIGLIDANTKAWYDAFKSIPKNVVTVVEVVDISI
ncbi:MAG: hypothetical protein IPP64_11775 [Bacteroidetes bacterium]|nr:hypothetical protein [Bacteroidota bacterium]